LAGPTGLEPATSGVTGREVEADSGVESASNLLDAARSLGDPGERQFQSSDASSCRAAPVPGQKRRANVYLPMPL